MKPPADVLEVVQAHSHRGGTKKGLCAALAVSLDVLNRWMDDDPRLQEAFDKGRESERQTLHNVLYEAAVSGNGKDSLIAAMFLLKTRHSYREYGEERPEGNRVSINFALPGAKPLDGYVIENQGGEDGATGAKRLPAATAGRS